MKLSEIFCLLFVLVALVFAGLMMPATELIPAQSDPGSIANGLSPVRSPAVMDGMKDVGQKVSDILGGNAPLKSYVEGNPLGTGNDAPGELKVYAMWAVWFSAAMVLAALAYGLLGRIDPEEKTVLPVKK